MDQQDHETMFVRSFIQPNKHERLINFLASPKKRRKATDSLYHMSDLNELHIVQIDLNGFTPHQVAQQLYDRGAPKTCRVISTNSRFDAKELELEFVLSEVIGWSDGTVLSCIPGKLAYYEGESPNNRFILRKS